MKEIGAKLQQARLEKGIQLEEIVHHTHIQLSHLQKIENGQFDFLPRPYVTAFIKTFAQYVGLNGEALVQRWHEQEQAEVLRLQQQQMQEAPSPKTVERKRISEAVALKPKSLAATNAASIPVGIPYLKELGLGFGIILVMAALVFLMSRSGNELGPMPPDDSTQTAKIAEPSQLRENPFEQVVQQAQQSTEPKAEVQTPPPTNELTLQAQFENQTRMRVVRDGKDTTITTYKPGETKTWQAKEKFNLRLSVGSSVTLTLAGKNLGKFGQVDKIEYLTITRAGVTSQRAVNPPSSKSRTAVPLDSVAIRRLPGF